MTNPEWRCVSCGGGPSDTGCMACAYRRPVSKSSPGDDNRAASGYPFSWLRQHVSWALSLKMLDSESGAMLGIRPAEPADLVEALKATDAATRNHIIAQIVSWDCDVPECCNEIATCVCSEHAPQALKARSRAAEARVKELEAELADVRTLGRQLHVIVDSYDRSQHGDLTEEEFQGTIEEARLMLASGAKP